MRGRSKSRNFTLSKGLFPCARAEPLDGGRARLVHHQVLVGEDPQPSADRLRGVRPEASRKSGFDGLPKRSLPRAKVS